MEEVLEREERELLTKIIESSGKCSNQSRCRTLLIDIGLNPDDTGLSSIVGHDFATQLVYDLNKQGDRKSLQEIFKIAKPKVHDKRQELDQILLFQLMDKLGVPTATSESIQEEDKQSVDNTDVESYFSTFKSIREEVGNKQIIDIDNKDNEINASDLNEPRDCVIYLSPFISPKSLTQALKITPINVFEIKKKLKISLNQLSNIKNIFSSYDYPSSAVLKRINREPTLIEEVRVALKQMKYSADLIWLNKALSLANQAYESCDKCFQNIKELMELKENTSRYKKKRETAQQLSKVAYQKLQQLESQFDQLQESLYEQANNTNSDTKIYKLDAYSRYEIALRQLNKKIPENCPFRSQFEACEKDLNKNINEPRSYGDTSNRQDERAEIVKQLDQVGRNK